MSAPEPEHPARPSPPRTGLLPAAGGALLLSAGLVCLSLLGFSLARDLSLWLLGRTVAGEVTELWVERLDEKQEGELSFRYLIRYRYTAPKGRTFTRESTLSAREWSGLAIGSPIPVIYFPLAPGHARLEDRRYAMVYLCGYLPFALIAWVAVRAGWHLLRSARSSGQGESAEPYWMNGAARREA